MEIYNDICMHEGTQICCCFVTMNYCDVDFIVYQKYNLWHKNELNILIFIYYNVDMLAKRLTDTATSLPMTV